MSNVFRSFNTISEEGQSREITIRNLTLPQDTNAPEELTLEVVLAERERLMKKAQQEIEQEKAVIEQLRQTAMEDISAMQVAWQDEKAILQQQAYDEGFQVGFEEGHNKVMADMASAIQIANETTAQSQKNAQQYLDSQERVILELGIRTAERILGQTLQDDEESYVSVVKRALKEAREMKEIKLYVSLDYFELVSDNRAELAAIFPPDVPFLIFANDEFEPTQCYIETNHGRIVVSIDEQLNELRERLVEIMESGD
ncbi:flagellar assembly protein FliH [Sporosarcina sp. YIM B06819]|uniref:flagellar assembly protein FliH n=1 Tax=Sporosarcina sp. YIM B06819 TaxID=3081769 RepID=UPI00298CA7F3|nr:flagellar assembly protein FliH [Sporosarcina sp. YIM B06819]